MHDFVHGIALLDVIDADAALDVELDCRGLRHRDIHFHRRKCFNEHVPVFFSDEDEKVVSSQSCDYFIIMAHGHDGMRKNGYPLVANGWGFGLVDVFVVLEVNE